LELILDPTVSNVTRPRCFGFSDGSIKVSIPNGKGPYQYNWNDGKGFQSNNLFGQIKAGSYKVDVRDANLCKGQFVFNVQDYPRLGFTVDQNDPSCFGTADGKVTLTGKGGNGGYKYRWGSGETTPSRSNLKAGTYPVAISDANDCILDTLATLVDPAQLFIDKIDVVNNKCYGDTTGQITVRGKGGTPPLSFSINGRPFRAGGLFTGLKAGRYTISIQDAAGCLVSKDTIIRQPGQLTVDAGIDLTINLGQNAQLRAFSSSSEVSYSWKPAEQLNLSTSQNPVANPVRTTDFEVTVTEKTGGKCSATDVVRVTVVKYRPIYAPNAFSPGSDNINSGYVLYGTPAARKIKMLRIFDRWGELVFEKPDINLGDENNGWNGMFKGKMMNPGVFVYVADVEFIDNEVISLKGEFTLVR
jgi:gliding motility-associated-like protein